MYSVPSVVSKIRNLADEPAYSCPFASYNYPNNPIPKPAVITPPTAPSGLVASNITPNSFTISWTPGVGAVDFTVSWGAFSAVVNGNTKSYTFTNLPESTTNICVVFAINAGGSAKSPPISVSTIPSTPTGLAFRNVTSTGFLCSWNYVSGVTYTVTWGAFNGTITGNGTASFTGLPGQTTNNLIVTANSSYPSAPLSVTTAPSAPAGFAVTRRGTNYLNISWTYVPNVTYNIVLGTYTGQITGNGTGKFTNLPVGYSATGQITATNSVGSSSTPIPSQTLLSPITFDTGNQNQSSGAVGFYLSPLSPGTFTVPTNFDIQNNGSWNGTAPYSVMGTSFCSVNAGFDYNPAQASGLFALRFAATTAPNPFGTGNPGDSWQNDIACITTGNTEEFRNLTSFTSGSQSWYFIPGDTITCFLLIAYGAWFYRTYNAEIDPSAIVAFWRISFTYNPFSTS